MRLLVNENIPVKSIALLRNQGHDVLAIVEESPGITDPEVLKIASKEKRILNRRNIYYNY